MKISIASDFNKRAKADLLIVPVWEGEEPQFFKEVVQVSMEMGDFKGKAGETALFYLVKEKEGRLLFLGLGSRKKATAESMRRAYSAAVKVALGKKAKSLTIALPDEGVDLFPAIWEGISLTNYAFCEKTTPAAPLGSISFLGLSKAQEKLFPRLQAISSGVQFVRDLVNGNADDITPKSLAETAKSLESFSPQIKTTLFDKKRLEKEKMGLILAVNRASSLEPFLIQVSYKGNPKSKDHVVIVGKGVTYDTGGLTLKPPDGMMTMRCDMAGAATALGVIRTAAALSLKVNLTIVAPVTENCIGSKSYKLGDIYRSYAGKTVEINNTDAEGRLVLADAIAYTVAHLKPSCVIDLATLTGAIVVALGEDYAGLFSNEEGLAQALLNASKATGELLWSMPLHDDYKDSLKSDIADLINTGGRDGGAIKAALFLQEFVGKVPWAHIDLAGPAFLTKPKHYNPTKGTGYGLRLLIEFLEKR